jgi:hypothetical protein
VEKAATARRRSSFPPAHKARLCRRKAGFFVAGAFDFLQPDDEGQTVSAGLENVATRGDTWKMELEPTWTTL